MNHAEEFETVLDEHGVVFVDFYADWCGLWEMLEPTVETLADDSPAAVARVDIGANRGIAQRENAQGVPTLQLYAGG